jgi:hypothetical protein
MGVEIVTDQPEPFGMRVTVIKKLFDLMRPIDSGALLADVNRTLPSSSVRRTMYVLFMSIPSGAHHDV